MKTQIREHVSLQQAVRLLTEKGFEVSYKTLLRWIKSNPPKLPATRLGRQYYILMIDLNRILHQNGNKLYRKMESLPE